MIPTCKLFMWQEGEYFEVRSMPVSEMLGRTETELADEWIEITNGIDWRERHRRPVKEYDVMQLGDINWMYLKTDGAQLLKAKGYVVRQLLAVPYYSIGRLSTTLKEMANEIVRLQ